MARIIPILTNHEVLTIKLKMKTKKNLKGNNIFTQNTILFLDI